MPRSENTIENPDTKNTEFKITFVLFMATKFLFPLNSLIVLPEIYAINAHVRQVERVIIEQYTCHAMARLAG